MAFILAVAKPDISAVGKQTSWLLLKICCCVRNARDGEINGLNKPRDVYW